MSKALLVSFALAWFATDALACSPTPAALKQQIPLDVVIAGHPLVFIGSVVKEDGAFVEFHLDIPIKGPQEGSVRVAQGGGGDCMNEFKQGQRWFFAGSEKGSSYFDRSTLLLNAGSDRLVENESGMLSVRTSEILGKYPQTRTLPKPSFDPSENRPRR